MDILDIIRQAQGGQAIANMARTFNLPPEQIEAAIGSLVPELARGIERNTLSRGGIADLVEAMGQGKSIRNMQNPAMFGDPAVQADGNAILGHILGTKDASRAAAHRASLSSGIGEGLLKMLLPYIAQLVMGALTKQTQGGLGDILSKIPGMPGNTGSPAPQQRGAGPSPFPQPRPRPQTRPAQPTAQPDHPWGPDTASGGGGFENQQPLPLPGGVPSDSGYGGNNPYGDLSDIIRGGRPAPGAAPTGGSLGNIIRDMLGGALGFPAKGGVMSWIFRAVLLRYGWSILRALLGGLLGGRR